MSKRIIGYVGKIDKQEVAGWTCVRGEASIIEVDLLIKGQKVAKGSADQFRKDLQDLGIHPTGYCGFTLKIPEGVDYDSADEVRVVANAEQSLPFSSHLLERLRAEQELERDKEASQAWNEQRDKYFFIHIPKTAGTSFRQMLGTVFTDEEIFPNNTDIKNNNNQYPTYQELKQYTPHFFQNKSLLLGHFPYESGDLLGKYTKRMVFLRDSEARAVSQLFHMSNHDIRFKESSLEEVFEQTSFWLSNLQVRYMSNNLGEEPVSRTDLEKAKTNLTSCEFVGITEKFDDSIRLLNATFPFSCGKSLRLNSNPSNSRKEIPESVLKWIKDNNQLDEELYEFGTKLFLERIAIR